MKGSRWHGGFTRQQVKVRLQFAARSLEAAAETRYKVWCS
jgi:hypothetical protein